MPSDIYLSAVIIMGILLTTMPSVQGISNETICENSFYYIISNLDSTNTLHYTNDSFIEFTITNEIDNSSAYQFINNYSKVCDFNNLKIPSPKKNFINFPQNNTFTCDLDINETFLGIIDMDNYFPPKFEGIIIGNKSCDEIDSFKYIVKYKKIDNLNYSIQGIKTWWIYTTILIFFMTLFARLILLSIRSENKFNKIKI